MQGALIRVDDIYSSSFSPYFSQQLYRHSLPLSVYTEGEREGGETFW